MILKFCALRARVVSVVCLLLLSCAAYAAPGTRANTASALMISDIHFDPFHDPAKVKALAAAPESGWEAILAAPASSSQQADLDKLQIACKAKGEDTDYALLNSALQAIREHAAAVRFVTVSGDLMAHKFACRWAQTMPGATAANYDSFVEKTLQYQAEKLQQALPHATLYLALGNNDSNCDDYTLDTGTPFLAAVAKIVGRGVGSTWTAAAAKDFATGGYYSVTMAAPMQQTRLIVVNDIFLSPGYLHCSGKPDAAPGAAQMQWLQQQLDAARKLHQRVWVMGHIPPGVNPYSTLSHGPDAVCSGAKPKMFMSSEVLGDTVAASASEIPLAIFAHTHMDELRLLGPAQPAAGVQSQAVALKLVPSISPVNGNRPSFLVAKIEPATATLADYTVYTAADAQGSAWTPEYTFSTTYGHGGFTPATLRQVIAGFTADAKADAQPSQDYMRFYTSGTLTRELTPFWPSYVCALANTHAADYTACVCGAK
ncbi:MAG: hypothetical protein P4L10_04420 [Acidobacteriaceae bacterium]|nr:hypothetical protein [Acidobacteriaceae bacterium]